MINGIVNIAMVQKIGKYILIVLLTCNCSKNNKSKTTTSTDTSTNEQVEEQNTISKLVFIDEFIIPDKEINGVPIGGFSGIDYKNGKWYIICDTSTPPIRYYEAQINYDKNAFTFVKIDTMIEIKDTTGNSLIQGIVDPEAIRFDPSTQKIIYTSEGSIQNNIDPALIEIDPKGNQTRSFTLPNNFRANTQNDTLGPRHNGVLEGLSLSIDNNGYWVSCELPLIEDGPEPTTTDTQSPVRITYINKTSGIAERQFAYELDPVARKATSGTTFEVNGLVEILEYDTNKFLALERSFSSGYADGGNSVKIYKVDASNATNTLSLVALSSLRYTPAIKTLLFNFDTIRNQLTNITVDNLEGITFGSTLEDGSHTIVVISDNNFNSFYPQYNQLIAFKVIP